MDLSGLPPEPETWAQFDRIIAHPLFANTSNRKGLLRFLIARRYSTEKDFSGKVIAFECFGRDTAIAKVEGRNLRIDLDLYYEGDGLQDDIIIRIPPKTFCPVIYRRYKELGQHALHMVDIVIRNIERPTEGSVMEALSVLRMFDSHYPRHPRLFGLRAVLYVMRTLFSLDPRDDWDRAEGFVADVSSRPGEKAWDVHFAKGCIQASRFQWKEANVSFEQAANATDLGYAGVKYNPWYTLFLASQRRFTEAINLLHDRLSSLKLRDRNGFPELVMMYVMAGDLQHAGFWASHLMRDADADEEAALLPAIAVLRAAEGKFDQAVKALDRVVDSSGELINVSEAARQTIIGAVSPGLLGLFCGLSGDSKRAKKIYSSLRTRQIRELVDAHLNPPRVPDFQMALAALGADHRLEAIRRFSSAVLEERHPMCLLTNVLPFMKPIISDATVHELVTVTMKLKLE